MFRRDILDHNVEIAMNKLNKLYEFKYMLRYKLFRQHAKVKKLR